MSRADRIFEELRRGGLSSGDVSGICFAKLDELTPRARWAGRTLVLLVLGSAVVVAGDFSEFSELNLSSDVSGWVELWYPLAFSSGIAAWVSKLASLSNWASIAKIATAESGFSSGDGGRNPVAVLLTGCDSDSQFAFARWMDLHSEMGYDQRPRDAIAATLERIQGLLRALALAAAWFVCTLNSFESRESAGLPTVCLGLSTLIIAGSIASYRACLLDVPD